MKFGLEGVIVPIITPKSCGFVDETGLANIADRAARAGASAIFALGTTGEFMNLDYRDKLRVISTLAQKSPIPLIVGVSAPTHKECNYLIDRCHDLSRLDSIKALVVTPEFGAKTLVSNILDSTDFPVILYNNPEITQGNYLQWDDVRAYASDPRVVGIKDSSGSDRYFDFLLSLRGDDFRVFQGKESQGAYAKSHGADGIVSGTANVSPTYVVDAWKRGDFSSVDRIREEIRGSSKNYVAAIKSALAKERVISSPDMFG